MSSRLCRLAVSALFSLIALALVSCNYREPWMYIDVVNNSGGELRNVEVDYPGGSFGLSLLNNEQTHRELVQVNGPCVFQLKMENHEGLKKITKNMDFGDKCPKEVSFNVGPNMLIDGTVVQP